MKSILLLGVLFLFWVELGAQTALDDATALVKERRYNEAKSGLEQIIKIDPKNAEALFQLGSLYLTRLRDPDKAVSYLEKAVELAPNNAEYHFALGRSYGAQAQEASIFSKGRLAGKSKDQFLSAVELQPNEVRYRMGLMGYYLRAPGIVGGSVEKAKKEADAIVQLDPYEGHIAHAQIAVYEKDLERAEREYMKAIEENPSRSQPYHQLGYMYVNKKRHADAVAMFMKYVKVAPNDPNSYDSLGDGYLAQGNIDAALEAYAKALAVDPDFAPSIFNLAHCYEKKGMTSEAVEAYTRYFSVAPEGNKADRARKKIKVLAKR